APHQNAFALVFAFFSLISTSFGADSFRFSGKSKAPVSIEPCSIYPCEMPGPVTLTGRFGESLVEGQADLIFPLNTPPLEGGLATFGMLSYLRNDYGQESYSLGLGARWLLTEANAVMGYRIHGDFAETALENQVNQLAFGFDLFHGKGWDFHTNFYVPVSSERSRRIDGSRTDVSESQIRNETYYDPYATGHQVRQGYEYETTTRTVTTDLSQVLQQREKGRAGGDARFLFDVYGKACGPKVRAMLGAYYYEGHFSDEIFGAMTGLYFIPSPGLQVGAEYYGDDELYGDHWIATVGASIPTDSIFNPGKWGRKEPAYSGYVGGKGYTPAAAHCQTDYLTSRLYANAPRLARPVTDVETTVISEEIVSQSVSETVTVEVGEKVIQDDVMFVNNGAAVGNGVNAGTAGGDGTAENPFDTIQAGADGVATTFGGSGTVYVQGGTGNTYTETINVGHGGSPAAGVTDIAFVTSLKGFQACGGLVFGGDTVLADLAGGFDLRNLNSAQVTGFSITGGTANAGPAGVPDTGAAGGYGILAYNVQNFVASCNTISGVSDRGILLFNDSVSNGAASITENTIDLAGAPAGVNGIEAVVVGVGNRLGVDIIDNNILNAPDCAIHLESFDNALLQATNVSNNTINGAGNVGISIIGNDTSTIQIDQLSGNTVNGTVARVDPALTTTTTAASVRVEANDSANISLSNVTGNQFGNTTALARGTGAGNADAEHGFRFLETGAGSSITVSGSGNTVNWDGPAAGAAGDSGNSVFATGDTVNAGALGFQVNSAAAIFDTDPYRLD
ncbi:MAG: right-handed parallel beta-helix repeat-containing protein, partial [Verrucomicrobiota bacterium]